MSIDPVNVASLLVALIAATGAWASQRASAKASTINTATTSRVDMEKEAYERARTYDTETIRRQDAEIEELREENRVLREEVRELRRRVNFIEHAVPTERPILPGSTPVLD